MTFPRRLSRRLPTATTGVLLALAGTACGGDAAAVADRQPGDGPVVVVTGMAYDPERLTIEAGEAVTWIFDDGAIRHDVAGDGFRSDVVASGTFNHTFNAPGTYEYVCTLHPNMIGAIEVTG